ncbi:MAG TPA: hypothetical protein VH475_27150 [Tepidisphaeraceae bacterium]
MKTNRLMLLLGVALVLGGCKREEGIRTYNAPKDPPAGQPTLAAHPGGANPSTGGEIQWTAPKDWKPLGASGMSYATFQVSENPPIHLTITPLPATAGEVLPNVNRWRGQLGMTPTTEAKLPRDVKSIKVAGQDAQLVDLTSPTQQRMLGAIVPGAGKVWFFKLSGPADKIAPQRDTFEEFVKSVQFGAPSQASSAEAGKPIGEPPVPAGGNAAIEGIASYTLPEGWQIDPNPRPMRAGTIVVGGGDERADLAITRLGANFGDKLSNINRWRAQAGLPPVGDPGAAGGQDVTLAQGPAVIYDFAGPESAGKDRKRLVVAMTQFPGAQDVWFFRLLGPHDLVAKNKPAFEAFVKSLKFANQ